MDLPKWSGRQEEMYFRHLKKFRDGCTDLVLPIPIGTGGIWSTWIGGTIGKDK